MTYYPYSNRPPEPYTEGGLGVAAELAAGGMAEVSGPLLVWTKPKEMNNSLPKPQRQSSINGYPLAGHSIPSQSNNFQRAGSGGSSQSLGQVLGNLQRTLKQLGAALSNYKKQ
jgi:hypothetical protein